MMEVSLYNQFYFFSFLFLEKSLAFLCGFEKGMVKLMNFFDKESISFLDLLYFITFLSEFTRHFLESKEKNLVFLKQFIDQDLS